jgi:hypothetical protein
VSENLCSEENINCSHFFPDDGFLFGDLNHGIIVNDEAVYLVENEKVRWSTNGSECEVD